MSDERFLPALRWARTRNGQILLAVAAVGAIYLLTEHWAHAVAYLPWLLILACPLMHLFMHGGHGAHGGQPGTTDEHDAKQGD